MAPGTEFARDFYELIFHRSSNMVYVFSWHCYENWPLCLFLIVLQNWYTVFSQYFAVRDKILRLRWRVYVGKFYNVTLSIRTRDP